MSFDKQMFVSQLYHFYSIFRLLPQLLKAEEDMSEFFGQGFCGNLQHKLYNLVENPNSSPAAKVSLLIDTHIMFNVY